jgi:hypothetical protein
VTKAAYRGAKKRHGKPGQRSKQASGVAWTAGQPAPAAASAKACVNEGGAVPVQIVKTELLRLRLLVAYPVAMETPAA